MVAIGIGILAMGAALGGAIGNGILFSNVVSGVARNPEASKEMQKIMFIGMAIVEVMPIITVVIGFMLMGYL